MYAMPQMTEVKPWFVTVMDQYKEEQSKLQEADQRKLNLTSLLSQQDRAGRDGGGQDPSPSRAISTGSRTPQPQNTARMSSRNAASRPATAAIAAGMTIRATTPTPGRRALLPMPQDGPPQERKRTMGGHAVGPNSSPSSVLLALHNWLRLHNYRLVDLFRMSDINNGGDDAGCGTSETGLMDDYLSRDELMLLFQKCEFKISRDAVVRLIDFIDTDGDHQVSLPELEAAMHHARRNGMKKTPLQTVAAVVKREGMPHGRLRSWSAVSDAGTLQTHRLMSMPPKKAAAEARRIAANALRQQNNPAARR